LSHGEGCEARVARTGRAGNVAPPSDPAMRFLLLCLAACVTPAEGTYAITPTNTETTCPSDYFPAEAPDDTLEIQVDTDVPEVVLVLIPEEHCPLTGLSFECAYAGVDDSVDHNADGIDAVYVSDGSISGEWSDSTHITGRTSLSSACTGEGCAELAESGFPACTVVWYWSGELVEE